MIMELLIIAIILILAVLILRNIIGFTIKVVYYALIVFAILFIIGLIF